MSVAFRTRAVKRIHFNQLAQQVEEAINEKDEEGLQWKLQTLAQKRDELAQLNNEILQEMLNRDPAVAEDEINQELQEAEQISYRGQLLINRSKTIFDHPAPPVSLPVSKPARSYKLPKIELHKFGGELKDWTPFWCLFQKIDQDPELGDEVKFQYLLQSISPGTRARKLVESYPPIGANYRKAITALKARFGREDLLIEYYFGELMKLTLSLGSAESQERSLADIYDLLETQLNSLETLGVSTSTFSMALFPLVESCLSAEQLRTWRRSDQSMAESATDKLRRLIQFLENEVLIEEAIRNKAKGQREQNESKSRVKTTSSASAKPKVPTSADLVSSSKIPQNNKCVFCEEDHANHTCKKAEQMTLQARKEVLSSKRCCFRCMRAGHRIRDCRANVKCETCQKRHATLVCWQQKDGENQASVTPTVENNLASTSYQSPVYLQTLLVVAKPQNQRGTEITIRILFDTGSQHSYLRTDLAIQLGYESNGEVQLQHSLFGGNQSSIQTHRQYKVWLRSLDGRYHCNFDVLSQSVICSSVPTLESDNAKSELEAWGMKMSPDDGSPIDLLIGSDLYGKLVTGRRKMFDCGLVGFETNFGWVVTGKKTKNDERCLDASNTMTATTMLTMMNPDSVCKLWELEVLGIQDPYQKKTKEKRAEETHKFFLDTVRINDEGRYEVRLPWIEDHVPIPRNFSLAKRRLDRTIMKLNEANLRTVYGDLFKEWLNEGILEVVDLESWDKGTYLPHRPVFRDSKTTPVRPVFDASAQEKGYPSLNQCLEKGINLIEHIPKLLIIFRLNRIGVISDIRKAFQQISLGEDDRDFLRFLWVKEDGTLMIYRHARVVFGVTSSPYLLGATIDHHLCNLLGSKKYDDELLHRLRKSFYVDNCIASVESEEELIDYRNKAIAIFLEAKMELRCWESTDPSLESEEMTHVLGLLWNRRLDYLSVNPSSWETVDISKITRRTLMSVAHRVFDPIGFCCPTTLCPKLLLQQCWEGDGGWQEEIPESLQVEFLNWYHELAYLRKIQIPRWVAQDGEVLERSVHIFCDASKVAYSAVVYLRTVTSLGISVNLILAKSRVAPSSDITMPRLELLAALIGSRLASSVKEVLGTPTQYMYWSDSSTVITWINRDENWGVFVHNRVAEIRSLSRKEEWRHVPGGLNPADLPSRGCSPKSLFESKWWEGPGWLRENEDRWPVEPMVIDEHVVASERKRSRATVALLANSGNSQWLYDRVSGYEQTVRLVAWVLRFIQNCRAVRPMKGTLLCKEILNAEKFVWRAVQKESFKSVEDPKIHPLVAYVDEEGLMRVKTKVTAREDSYDFRFPLLLPSDHVLVQKLVLQEHQRACHVGVQGLLSIMRERFWILKGRQTVRTILRKCVNCARYDVQHAETHNPPLPEARVRDAEVFEVSGVDFFGPLTLRDERKVYVAIFTCAVYRAVHLELAVSLTTGAFIQVLKRFIARRGRPSILYSDNAKNFTGANAAFNRLNWENLARFCNVERIEWRFNPPSSPWWGGWWERLVGIVKQMLKKTLGKASVTYEELETLLCDCEATMNDRPLTYMSENNQDLVPLTPSMFLRGIRQAGVMDCDVLNSEVLGKRAKYIQKLTIDLRKRFRSEYLGKLARAAKKTTRTLKIGEVVLIGSDDKKRIDWPLARIVGFVAGKDGVNRVVKLTTAKGEVTRPIQRVYPLEGVQDDIVKKAFVQESPPGGC